LGRSMASDERTPLRLISGTFMCSVRFNCSMVHLDTTREGKGREGGRRLVRGGD
jgi:hypothetical protein